MRQSNLDTLGKRRTSMKAAVEINNETKKNPKALHAELVELSKTIKDNYMAFSRKLYVMELIKGFEKLGFETLEDYTKSFGLEQTTVRQYLAIVQKLNVGYGIPEKELDEIGADKAKELLNVPSAKMDKALEIAKEKDISDLHDFVEKQQQAHSPTKKFGDIVVTQMVVKGEQEKIEFIKKTIGFCKERNQLESDARALEFVCASYIASYADVSKEKIKRDIAKRIGI